MFLMFFFHVTLHTYIGYVNTMYEVVSSVCYKLGNHLMQIDSPTTIQCFIRLYEVLSYRMHVFKISFFWVKRIFLLIYLSAKKKPTKLLCTGKKNFLKIIIQLPLRIPIRGNSKTRELVIVIFCVSVHI